MTSSPITREVRFACSIEHAFTVFTRQLDGWWPVSHRKLAGSEVLLEAGIGGRFLERADDGREAVLGEVIRWDPPRAFAYHWRLGSAGGPTEVAVSFESVGDHTLVTVVHSEGESGLGADWPERAKLFDRAWSAVLVPYQELAEREE